MEFVRAQYLSAVRQRRDDPDALIEYLADSVAFAPSRTLSASDPPDPGALMFARLSIYDNVDLELAEQVRQWHEAAETDPFHETFVTLGFLAAVTKTIRLSTGVLIAPQRQTGLIAKQARE